MYRASGAELDKTLLVRKLKRGREATVGGKVDHFLHLSDDELERIAASGIEDVATIDAPMNGQLRIAGPDAGAALNPADAE